MFDLLEGYDGSESARASVLSALKQRAEPWGEYGDRSQVGELEQRLQTSSEESFCSDSDGFARLGQFQAGRFTTPKLGELKQRAQRSATSSARARLWVLDGTHPLTDIGSLQAWAPPDSLFQVASQFNCLESPGPYLMEVADYFLDPTQGPRASISAFPGTLLRQYRAPDKLGGYFVQGIEGRQINLLSHAARDGAATVQSGYLLSHQVHQPEVLANRLVDEFDEILVGLHEGVEVVLGGDWDGPVRGRPLITQVFSSTLAAGPYSKLPRGDEAFDTILRQLQRAAYLGALLAAAATNKKYVALTLIGGGVFGNPLQLIWDSILWAVDQVQSCLAQDLLVLVNTRTLAQTIPTTQLRQAALERGGDLLVCRSWGFALGEA
jgi:hypothetical protein